MRVLDSLIHDLNIEANSVKLTQLISQKKYVCIH